MIGTGYTVRIAAAAALMLGALGVGAADAATRVVVFPFEMFDTSGQSDLKVKAEETKRLEMITAEVAKRFAAGGYDVADLAPQRAQIEDASPFRNCNNCELPIARALGGDIEVLGLVQKVSTLILNINFQVRDVATGQVLRAGSADIRNDTDESWMRGISYLIRNRLFDPPLTGKAAP